jgi:hypothetical protein
MLHRILRCITAALLRHCEKKLSNVPNPSSERRLCCSIAAPLPVYKKALRIFSVCKKRTRITHVLFI